MISEALKNRFYGDPRYDGTRLFYTWLRERITPRDRVLNLGAGLTPDRAVRSLKGEVAELVGADIDPDVLQNTGLDRAVLIEGDHIPLESASFDLIYADYVLEHIEKPDVFLAEVFRLLKPGASFFFRTPNIFHYTSLVSALTTQWMHEKIANRVRGAAEDAHDPYPTFYRMNSRGALTRQARTAGFGASEFRMIECEPSYLVFHAAPFMVGVGYERLVNSTSLLAGLRGNIQGRMEKPRA